MEKALYTSLKDVALQSLVNGFLNSSEVVAIIKPAMDALGAALANDDPSDDDAALDAFDRALDKYAAASERFAGRTRAALQRRGLLPEAQGTNGGSLTNIPGENTGANKVGSVSYQVQSSGVIGSDQTFRDFGANVSSLSAALKGAQDVMQVIRETASTNLQAAQLQMQAAGQQFAARASSALEQARLTFATALPGGGT